MAESIVDAQLTELLGIKNHGNVVRCMRCKKGKLQEKEKHPRFGWVYCTSTLQNGNNWWHKPDWYCADGEAKDGE